MDSSKEENEYKTCRQKEPVKNIWSKYSFSPWIFSRWRTILTLLHLDINWVSSLSYSNFHLVISPFACIYSGKGNARWGKSSCCWERWVAINLATTSRTLSWKHQEQTLINKHNGKQNKTKQNKKERTQYKQIAEILFQQGVWKTF